MIETDFIGSTDIHNLESIFQHLSNKNIAINKN